MQLVQHYRSAPTGGMGLRPVRSTLTDREWEVLTLLVQGVTSNRELAQRLVVSENTVKFHLRNILAKLHLQNRAQIVAYAHQYRLVDQFAPSSQM